MGDAQGPNGEAADLRVVASTERLASDGGVILLGAWRLDRFRQNPVFLALHDAAGFTGTLTETVAGRVVWIGIESGIPKDLAGPSGKALVAYVRFAGTAFGREVRQLYEEGNLSAVSVRWDWRTEETRQPTAEEVEQYGQGLEWVATRADLLELSAVPIGADPGALAVRQALARCRAKGLHLPRVERALKRATDVDQEALNSAIWAVDDAVAAAAVALNSLRDSVAELKAALMADDDDEDRFWREMRDVLSA